MLELIQLHKSFNKGTPYEKRLYNGLSLRVEKGDFVTVIGSNGAGKSTLFKLITNEMSLDQGEVFISDVKTTSKKPFETAKFVSSVLQDPKLGTLGEMTVFENLSMASLKGFKLGFRKCQVQEKRKYFKSLLEPLGLGLEDNLDVPTNRLSGGQRQVLSLIMVTLCAPNLLLLDEHTAALDPITSQKVMHLTEGVVRERGLTCMMITHKIQDAIDYGNRLILLDEGRVLLDFNQDEKEQLTVEGLMKHFQEMKSQISDSQIF